MPHERVVQMHLAGHTNCGTHLIDTHDGPVIDQVWELFRLAHGWSGGVSTLLEWDANIPDFSIVHQEVLKAKRVLADFLIDSSDSSSVLVDSSQRLNTIPHPSLVTTADVE